MGKTDKKSLIYVVSSCLCFEWRILFLCCNMDFFEVKLKMKWCLFACVLVVANALTIEAQSAYEPDLVLEYTDSNQVQSAIVLLDSHVRQRRDAPTPSPSPSPAPAVTAANVTHPAGSTTVLATPTVPSAGTTASTAPANVSAAASAAPKTNATNDINRTTKLENFTNVFETPEMVRAERNFSALKYDNHTFYNSSFIGDPKYFAEHWANITATPAKPHDMLSHSYRKATTVQLSFRFPFYGHWIKSVTVATGGFVYTGEHTHSWLAATQYIAPLMANFDTSLTNLSRITLADDGEKFTAFWEQVALREHPSQLFTFAVTLYNNGDIAFAYKQIPLAVNEINDTAHPVKIGISDAYFTDKIIFYVRRKTVYEYHRVSFKHYEVTNGTVLRLTALPTCLQYSTCTSCLNHNTSFPCAWCENIKKCSGGTDRNKQDWTLRSCEHTLVKNASSCPAETGGTGRTVVVDHSTDHSNETQAGGGYVTDGRSVHDADVRTLNLPERKAVGGSDAPHAQPSSVVGEPVQSAGAGGSAVGGVAVACACVALVFALAAWALYAFRNPHTRSGQLFIKYRPSQWNWRRGEARYTAATIHM
ncbi:hypothetical protein evm_010713 [Chilo suppressalis]|nr:hypothetical protein evm_010713 [Chilo suppressalis]